MKSKKRFKSKKNGLKFMKDKSDLKYCPFCGAMISWKFENDVIFSNIQYLKCRNCKAEISINKNSIKDNDLFNEENVFTVENVGGYNFAKLSPTNNLTTKELLAKAYECQRKVEEIKQNKKNILNVLIDDKGKSTNTPKDAWWKARRKKFSRIVLIILTIILFLIILYIII